MMKSYQDIWILNVKIPENISLTKKEYIHMLGLFLLYLTLRGIFFLLQKLLLLLLL